MEVMVTSGRRDDGGEGPVIQRRIHNPAHFKSCHSKLQLTEEGNRDSIASHVSSSVSGGLSSEFPESRQVHLYLIRNY